MRIRFSRFLISCCSALIVLLAGAGHATTMDREFIDVIQSQGKSYLIASLFRDTKPVDRPLIKVGEELRGGDNSKAVQLLRQYYQLMINGEPKKAATLFYGPDGSKERFINGLIDMPDRYAGYQMLERIDFHTSFGWGPFEIYEVTLSGTKVGSLRWREAVICGQQQCYLSNQIDTPESELREFASIRDLMASGTGKQQQLADNFNQLPNKAFFLPNEAMSYANLQNTQYPMTFSFTMEQLKPVEIDLSKPVSNNVALTINGVDASLLVKMIKDITALAPLVADQSLRNQGPNPAKDKVITSYNNVVDKYTSQQSSRDIYLYSMFEDQQTKQQEFRREWYHPVAAVQRISRWTKLTVLGYIPQNDKQIALFFQPMSVAENGDEVIEPIQGIAIAASTNGSQILLSNFRNNVVQKINYALEAPVLNELGKKYAKSPTFIYPL